MILEGTENLPEISVRHFVPASRLTRRYFRQWFYWHGKTTALMMSDLFPELDLTRVPRILGVPRFLYRQAAGQFWKYLTRVGREDSMALLSEELWMLRYAGMITECWKRSLRRMPPLGTPQATPELVGR